MPESRTSADKQIVEVIHDVGDLAASAGRADLAKRLTQTRERLADPSVRVIVVGEFKQGKSKLINALVNAPACPVDDDVATSVPTTVGFAEQPIAWVIEQPTAAAPDPQRREVPLDALAEYVSERGNPGNERGIMSAEVLLPREILRGGLKLVDSPGVGGLESSNSLATLAALSSAHAVLLVSDASQEYTEPEVQFLRHAMRISPNVAAVLAKTDLYPQWRRIEEIDRDHLGHLGASADVPIFSVSSDLRLLAAELQDRTLNDESGFPALVAHLRREVLGRAETIHERSAVHELVSVVDQLEVSLRAELNALLNPEDTPRMIAELEDAKTRADEFRGRSARWQVTLTDGIADLVADMEHDVRDRLRKVQREAERAIDEGDPGPIWDQIREWLDQRVTAAVSETFVWTDERSRWLSEEVAELFSKDEAEIPISNIADIRGVLDPVEGIAGLDAGQLGAGEKIYIGVRGSYGGVLMVGLATGLIGMALINPLSLLAGVLVGRRAYREDMGNRLTRRQAEAKGIVRRHIDEVTFQVGKQLRDRLRFVQRTARDHFGSLAEELHSSLSEALLRAKQAATGFTSSREQHIGMLQSRVLELERVRRMIPAMPALPAPSTIPTLANTSESAGR
ncbi:ISONIAZID INDUCTIBLE GENE PROTEIN INIA [Microbacterium esteraromaticum]|uniref:ISONIAZID INDUCTIBLE GENE PROTEIN INIA n=1 Tax=Microbacterium esteraromaticum TaxID=57043 RepID=A0A1R4J5D2_9MICO|nr:dynamin family protein [Microbacterium esteraromaticum]SJN27296.1 ISONIAZID INDUCTIBLE GENE PROTEIN INIA [Microbacterium esteraromaticum]